MPHTALPDSLTLVIPCYNEEQRIDLLYAGLVDFMDKCSGNAEIIIVNDGSKDNTLHRLQGHDAYRRYQSIITILDQENTGKGGALQHGVAKARNNWILTLDADMASPPAELHKWLSIVDGNFDQGTVYIGSREHPQSVISNAGKRKFAGRVFNKIVQLATGLRLQDTQCGFKLYPAQKAKKYFAALQTPGWAHDVELLMRAKRDGLRISEMPIHWTAIDGSKINMLRDSIKMLRETLHIVRLLRKESKK